MSFDYDRLAGQIDFASDSEAIRNYKAGAAVFVCTLKRGGWTDVQVKNSMRTLFESVSAVLAEHVLEHFAEDPLDVRGVVREAVSEIHIDPLPCSHKGCAPGRPGGRP